VTHFEKLKQSWKEQNGLTSGSPFLGAPAVITGRSTHSNEYVLYSSLISRQFQEYHNKNLNDIGTWDHKSILKIIRQISPEASQAITTYLRVFDSGYTITCRMGNGKIHQQAQNKLRAWISKAETPNGKTFEMPKTIRDMALKYALDALIKGSVDGELVLDERLNPTEPVYVDPWSITFEWNQEQERWIPRQLFPEGYHILDIPTFFHVPVDPLGNDPYGEEQINSAIRAILFKIQVMQDLKMAVHKNAWSRLDYKLVEEAVTKEAPPAIRNDSKKLSEYVGARIQLIKDTFQDLNPDDDLVHTDAIEVKGLDANTAGKGVFDPTPLIQSIDSQVVNALKTFQSILSKKLGGGSEGFTSIEGVLYLKIIAGFQSVVEDLFERMFTMALRYMGIMATVEFEFEKPDLRSDKELSQFRRVELENIAVAFDEQAIGKKEKATRIREILGFEGEVPEDISEERVSRRNGGQPNEPERPPSSEDGKEERRSETNRGRRSGQQ
jgi:hypothetical protein